MRAGVGRSVARNPALQLVEEIQNQHHLALGCGSLRRSNGDEGTLAIRLGGSHAWFIGDEGVAGHPLTHGHDLVACLVEQLMRDGERIVLSLLTIRGPPWFVEW